MNIEKKIGIAFPFDFLNIYGGACNRVKSDISAFKSLGLNSEVFFPTKSTRSQLKQKAYEFKTNLNPYLNFQRLFFLPEKARLLLDEYGLVFNPFFYIKLKKQSRKLKLLFAHFPITFLASYLALGKTMPILYVAHNFEYSALRQTTRNPLARKIIYYVEKYTCLKATRVLCVTKEDKSNLQITYRLPPEKLVVIPTCIDLDYLSQTQSLYDKTRERQNLGIQPRSFVLLYSGRMDYRPNIEALKFILDKLVPALERDIKSFEVLIAGAQIPAWCLNIKKHNISFHTDVPDMRRFYAVADAAIVPLNAGSGIRVKILESFAARLPVVSTEIGCEGIDCQDGKHILIAQRNAEDFKEKVTNLYKNPEKRENLAQNAYELVAQKYSFNVATILLHDLIREIELKSFCLEQPGGTFDD
jgi:glycosyltransferase involved in cell wall biosynthesis